MFFIGEYNPSTFCMAGLFENHLQANTITSYRSALVKPLLLGLNHTVDSGRFTELCRAFFHIRPPPPMVKLQWSLNKVLDFFEDQKIYR